MSADPGYTPDPAPEPLSGAEQFDRADVELVARALCDLAWGSEDDHAPWNYTEFGVECACGAAIGADDRCTANWSDLPAEGKDEYRLEARAVLAALAAAGRLRAPVLFEVERWKVDLPQGSVKGIAESDARRLAAEHGGTASRSVVRLLTDEKEELDSWQKVSGS